MNISKIKEKIKSILLWSQKYTKTDMLYLAKGGFWLTFDQIASSAASLALALVFANLVPKDIYGTYKYILSIAGLLTAMTLTGMNTAVNQAVARGFEGTLKKSFWIQIKWNVILLVIALFGCLYYWQNNKILAISLIIIGLASPIINSANTYIAFLNGKKQFKDIAKFGITSRLVSTISIILVIILSKNILILIVTYFASNAALNLFFYFYTIKKFKPNNNHEEKTLLFGKHLSLINVLSTVGTSLGNITIFHFLGSLPVALYNIACAPVEQINGANKNLISLISPKLASKSFEEINTNIYKRTRLAFLVGLAIALVYILIIPFIFKLFFPKYLDSVFLSQIYSLILPLTLPLTILSSALQAKLVHMPKNILYKIYTIPQIALIVLILVLTIMFGVIGTIMASIIHKFITCCIYLFYWKKISNLKIA